MRRKIYFLFIFIIVGGAVYRKKVISFFVAVNALFFQDSMSRPSIEITKKNRKNYIEQLVINLGAERRIYTSDVRLWPNGSEVWDWKRAGTHHVPGIQVADIVDLLSAVDNVILTRGVDGVLQIPQATIDYCKNAGKAVYTGRTHEMIALYNRLLQEGKKVAALIHTTC